MKHKILAFLAVVLVFQSCTNANEDITIQSVDNSWPKNKPLVFTFNVDDAQTLKNISFVVRNNNSYPYSNIRFFVSQADVQNRKAAVTDTVNFTLAKANGEWLGKGFGETKEIIFPYKTGYRFPKNGKYEFTVKQAMRNDQLPGVEDIGIKIETKTP